MILLVTIVNVLGTRKSANLQGWATAIKVIAIVLMCAVLLVRGRGLSDVSLAVNNLGARSLLFGVGFAMIGVL